MNTLYNDNCLNILPKIPDNSIDLILTDLPYGITQNKWDCLIDIKELWKQFNRICCGTIVLNSCEPFTSFLVMSNIKLFKYRWTWNKITRQTGFLNAKKQPLRVIEDLVVFYDKLKTYHPQLRYGFSKYTAKHGINSSNYRKDTKSNVTTISTGERYPLDILEIPAGTNADEDHFHPTQKPVELAEYMIKTYTNKNDTVLDCCMGSGTTGVAAIKTNRNFIGIELNSEYFGKAKKRIESANDSENNFFQFFEE